MLTTEEGYPAFRTGNRDYAAGVGGDGQEHGDNWKREGEVPAFGMTWGEELGSIHVLNASVLGRLPQPERGFGLYLTAPSDGPRRHARDG